MGEKLASGAPLRARQPGRGYLPTFGAPLCLGKVMAIALAVLHGLNTTSPEVRLLTSLGKDGRFPRPYGSTASGPRGARLDWIYWGDPEGDIGSPKWFDIDDSFTTSGFHEHWPVHYSRMVENQLDVGHLPFIHHNSIGRGGKMVVDGPLVRLENDTLSVWVYNRLDDGTTHGSFRTPSRSDRHSVFNFPNMWQNGLARTRLVSAFCVVEVNQASFNPQLPKDVRWPSGILVDAV